MTTPNPRTKPTDRQPVPGPVPEHIYTKPSWQRIWKKLLAPIETPANEDKAA